MNNFLFDVQQGSEEWLQLRRGKVTGTGAHTVMVGKQGKETYMLEKLAEIVSTSNTGFISTPSMERGKALEEYAAKAYELATFETRILKECGAIIHPIIRDFMVSPDRLLYQDDELIKGIEIKCFEWKHHLGIVTKIKENPSIHPVDFIDKNYYTQIQSCMSCSGLSEWDLVLYNPDFSISNLDYFEFTIKRDNNYIKIIEDSVEKFIIERDERLLLLNAANDSAFQVNREN